jgi:HlyD family secretion protein
MRKEVLLGSILVVVLLSACGAGAEPTPTPLPEQAFASVVSVTGEILPAEWTTVSARAGGTAMDVLVEPGDEVSAGDPLVRLDSADAEIAVARAEMALEAAQIRLALLESRPRPEDIAVAEANVEAAGPDVEQAEARLAQLEAGALNAEIASTKVEVTSREIDELVAHELHEDTMTCVDVTIPGEGEKEICPLLGPPEEKARFRLHAAREALDAAWSRYYALINQKDDRLRAVEVAVEVAEEQRAAAEAQLAQAKAGSSEEDIVAAEAAIRQAEVALEKAEVAAARTEILAPLDGTVGMVQVREHELVAPGQPLVAIGDLTTLRVETTDLDEIDVARVQVGQEVDVTFDALPDQVFAGQVKRIYPLAETEGAGVNYTAIVELASMDPQIRWGMTAFVDIEVEG